MKLAYRVLGEGTPLFILHGLFGMADNWNTLGKGFSEHFKVFLIDQRNHGHSPHSDDWNYKVMSEDLLELCEEQSIDKVSIIGHSMGGKVAMQFTVDHCNLVEKLVVADIAPKYYRKAQRDVVEALQSVDLDSVASRKEVEQQLEKTLSDFGTRQFLLKNLYWNDQAPAKLRWRFNLPVIADKLTVVSESFDEENNRCDAPALFVRGSKSDYVLDEDQQIIKKVFPDSRLATIADAGHWLHADKPKEFFEEVLGFLKGEAGRVH